MQSRVTNEGIEWSDDFDAEKGWADALNKGIGDVCRAHNASYIFVAIPQDGNMPIVGVECTNHNEITNVLGSIFIRLCEDMHHRDALKTFKKILKSREDYEKKQR